MDYSAVLLPIGVALVRLFVGFVLTLFSVYYGVKFFDKLTRNIDEWKEVKKGNIAVGLMLGAVVLSIALLTAPGIFILSSVIDLTIFSWPILGIGILAYIVAFLISLFSIYMGVRLLDAMDTQDADKIAALKKGNVAMGIFVAAIIFSVSAVIFILEVTSFFSFFPILID